MMINQPSLLPNVAPQTRIDRLKQCAKCVKFKPYAAFYVDRSRHDQKTTRCILCIREWKREYDRSEMGHKNNRNRKRRDYDKVQARRAVHNAILAGGMKPAKEHDCVHCGRQAKHWHHPNGYSIEHWFDVEAVCVRCHVDIHDPFIETPFGQLRLGI